MSEFIIVNFTGVVLKSTNQFFTNLAEGTDDDDEYEEDDEGES